MIPYTLNEGGVTFFYKGRQRVVAADHPYFKHTIEAVIANDTEEIDSLIDLRNFVVVASAGDVTVCSDDVVRFRGVPVPEYLAMRIVMHYNDGYPIEPLCKFAEKLMSNPTADVREDLYKWLENGNMPIFPDGDFAAYKLVRDDFSPIHTGPYGADQSPGTLVKMPRHLCNENRDVTCSTGLHFCSYEYLPQFQSWNNDRGQKVILLKISPADVVAIPTDYNLSKGRCCEFFVVEEIDPESIKADFDGRLVLSKYNEPVVSNEYDTWENDDAWEGENLVDHIDEETWEADHSKSNVNVVDWNDVSEHGVYRPKVNYRDVTNAIQGNGGNKTAAARDLGISRSMIYKILADGPPVITTNKDLAQAALNEYNGNKTRAAAHLGIARSTLSRWLYK